MIELADAILSVIKKTPDVVWSGVISAVVAAGISLFSVRSTNKGSAERLRTQHEFDLKEAAKQREVDLAEAEAQRAHDARQKAEDRKAAIRREVYIEAVESVHKVLAYFGGLADVPLNKPDEILPFQEFLAANSKVWLVAERDASHMSRELTTQVGEALFAMLQAAYPLRLKLQPLCALEEDIINAQAELTRIQSRLIACAEQNQEITRFQQSYERANAWLDELRKRKDKLEEGIATMRYGFALQSMELLEPVQETLVRLVSSLRAELDLDADLSIFMAQYNDQKERMKKVLHSVTE